VDAAVDALGHVPLPPYIGRPDTAADRERYQTVFAAARGSVAAPTAGLHFDAATIDALGARGVAWATVTLHVGYGTFKPVRVDRVEDHAVDPERYLIPERTAEAIRAARAAGRRVVAAGTTTTRALESAATGAGITAPGPGVASLFIHPGHEFKVVTALLTNFHLPKSSLLMLVAAFAGHDLTMAAYRHAVAEGFRFYSYGDAMLIL
jgi:S-adenosylmethionine:tRNA ribosyltransferase-isomerase